VTSLSPREPGQTEVDGSEAPGDGPDSDAGNPAGEPLPMWFERGVVVVAAAVVSFGGFGLLLAVMGSYHLAVVLPVGAALTVALSWLAWPHRPRHRRGDATPARGAAAAAMAMCLLALVSMAWNGLHAGHHVAIGRDPGVYAVTGKWIATRGNLEIHTDTEWTSKTSAVTTLAGGTYTTGPNTSQFQFDHLTATLLAEGDNLGGDRLMFRVPAILGALGLCAVYGAGCRMVKRPWLVLAAVTGLAVAMPQLNTSRDTLSESSVQLLLWAGLLLLATAYERRRPGTAVLAGAALAGIAMSRIDAPVYLIPLPLVAALAWIWARSATDRRNVVRLTGSALAGALPVAVIGVYDVQNRSGHYYADLHSEVHLLQVGLIISTLVAVAVVGIWALVGRRLSAAVGALAAHRNLLAGLCGGLTTLFVLAMWLVRPALQTKHGTAVGLVGALQKAGGLSVDPTRTYAEQSLHWFSWYIGPVSVALFAAGAGIVIACLVRRPAAQGVLVMSCAGLGTALYLWKPSISPDQIWAMRRFVPAGLPLALLLAAAAVAAAADLLGSWRAVAGTVAAAAGAAALIVPPAAVTSPVRAFVPASGESLNLAGVKVLCAEVGPRAAVLTASSDIVSREIVGAVRAWCRVPVATMSETFSATQIADLARQWQAEGRTLWVIGSTPSAVTTSAPHLDAHLLVAVDQLRELEKTIGRAPSHYTNVQAAIFGTAVQG